MPESKNSEERIRLLPLDPAPFSLCLVRRSGDGKDGEWRAGPQGDGSRSFEAVLVSETGAVIDQGLLTLTSDDDSGVPFPELEQPLTNAARDQRWQALRSTLEALGQQPRFFPELLLPAADGVAGAELGPLVFCPVPHRLFPIPCPECFTALRTCRVDSLLVKQGLPPYSSSSRRLLYCAGCTAESGVARFYDSCSTDETETAADRVLGLPALFQSLAAVLTKAQAKGGLPSARTLPCTTCPQSSKCLGDGTAPPDRRHVRWELLTAHDTPYVLTRNVPLTLEQFVQITGGRPAAEVLPDESAISLVYAPEGSGIDAVEALSLRVSAFVQVLEGLSHFCRLLGRPHLNLHPDTVFVDVERFPNDTRRLWASQAKIIAITSARRAAVGGADSVVLPPGSSLKAPFFSPRVRDLSLIAPRPATLTLERVVAAGDGHRLEGRLSDPHGIYPSPGARDRIVLTWSTDVLGVGIQQVIGRLREGEAATSGHIPITSEPVAIPQDQAKRLKNVAGLQIPGVRYKVLPDLGVSDDLYSLGMTLLAMLLVNDEVDLGTVSAAALAALDCAKLADLSSSEQRHAALAQVATTLISTQPESFAKSNLFYRAVDRAGDRPNSLPDELWSSTLTLALSLLDAGTAPPDRPAQSVLDDATAHAEVVRNRLRTLLFLRQPTHVEIQSVLAELLSHVERVDADLQDDPEVPVATSDKRSRR
jgi:hypothetical protein